MRHYNIVTISPGGGNIYQNFNLLWVAISIASVYSWTDKEFDQVADMKVGENLIIDNLSIQRTE